jgi:hypothetical protein
LSILTLRNRLFLLNVRGRRAAALDTSATASLISLDGRCREPVFSREPQESLARIHALIAQEAFSKFPSSVPPDLGLTCLSCGQK